MTSDTPRTDAEILRIWKGKKAVWVSVDFARELEREIEETENEYLQTAFALTEQTERAEKAEAEIEFWKAKAYEAEQSEGKHEAEVEHIKALLKDIPAVHTNTLRGNIATLSWDSYEHIIGPHPCRERAENAEAEVERLKSQLARAVEIADIGIKYITTGGESDSEAFPKDTGWVTDEEIEDWQRKLDALKGEIK